MSQEQWSDDVYHMLKSTEKTISSIKNRLSDKKKIPTTSSSLNDSLRHFRYKATQNTFSPIRSIDYVSATPTLSESSLVTSLCRRIEEQSKTISHLSDVVQFQTSEIQTLKNRQMEIETRLSDSPGVNFSRKLDSVQRELRNEIDSIRSLLTNSQSSIRSENIYGKDYRIFQDIKAQRQMIEDETDSIRREVDVLKDRIMKIESNMHASVRDSHEVNRRVTGVQRDVSAVSENQRSLRQMTDRKESELQYLKKQIQEISDLVLDLNHDSANSTKRKVPQAADKSYKLTYTEKRLCSSEDEDDLFKDTNCLKRKLQPYLNDDSPLNTLLSQSSDLDISLESLTLDGDLIASDDETFGGKDYMNSYMKDESRLKMEDKFDEDDLFDDNMTSTVERGVISQGRETLPERKEHSSKILSDFLSKAGEKLSNDDSKSSKRSLEKEFDFLEEKALDRTYDLDVNSDELLKDVSLNEFSFVTDNERSLRKDGL